MTTPTRILVTGSRLWTDHRTLFAALSQQRDMLGPLIVTHGGCATGAEHLAAVWCWSRKGLGVTEDRRPADWARHGSAAEAIRNQQMIDTAPALVLAFLQPKAVSPSATDCVHRAETTGIPVIHYPAPPTES